MNAALCCGDAHTGIWGADFDSVSQTSGLMTHHVSLEKIWMAWVSDVGLYLVLRTYYRWTELNWTILPVGLKVGQLYEVKIVLELEWEFT